MRKVISLSLGPELLTEFDEMAKAARLSHSELFRNFITERSRHELTSPGNAPMRDAIVKLVGSDSAQIVVGLAIIFHAGKVLVVSRPGQDPNVKNLHWAFPGGRLSTLAMRQEIRQVLSQRLGCDIVPNSVIGARVIPETTRAQPQVIAIYFDATATTDRIVLDPARYSECAWVSPSDVYAKFTTSTSDEISRYLASLPNPKSVPKTPSRHG